MKDKYKLDKAEIFKKNRGIHFEPLKPKTKKEFVKMEPERVTDNKYRLIVLNQIMVESESIGPVFEFLSNNFLI